MKDKVCSYELSKQLHDLNFDCDSHTNALAKAIVEILKEKKDAI